MTAIFAIITGVLGFLFMDRFQDGRATVGISLVFGFFLILSATFFVLGVFDLLSFCHPMPVVNLPSVVHKPGSSFPLAWTFPFRPRLMKRLTVTLRMIEITTYHRGTTPITDRIVYLTHPLYEGEAGLQSGTAVVAIPEDAMHSFETASNSILWAIHFDGESRWSIVPSLHYEAPLIVGNWR